MGNHEYYNSSKTTDQILQQARSICASLENVHLLERSTYDITDSTRILGCTLWSNMNQFASSCLNDMVKIRVKSESSSMKSNLTREEYFKWHVKDVTWLNTELKRCKDEGKEAVILTHHGPLLEMSGKYVGSPLSSAFVSDLKHLFEEPLRAWASGHVHSNVDTCINGVRSVSNAMGYPNESDVGYKEDVIISIDD